MAASPATPSLAERAEEGDGGTEWFYVDGAGVRRGPHNFRVVRAQLRCGVLDGDDLVWREGLPAWRPAAEIPVFASCVAGRCVKPPNMTCDMRLSWVVAAASSSGTR